MHHGDPIVWVKSSHSDTASCVELAVPSGGERLVRDSKRGEHGPVLVFAAGAWADFLRQVCRD